MFLTPDLIKSILKAELVCNYRVKINIAKSKFSTCVTKIEKEDIFITADVEGENENYCCAMEAAYLRGASAIITKKGISYPELPIPIIKVDDPVKALEKIATILIRNYHPSIVGITGNDGKTTTKDLIASLLQHYGKTCCNQDGANSIFELILAVLNADFPCKFLVLEIGISQLGDMDLFNQITLPKVGVITNIGSARLKLFKSIEATAMEKAKIFQNGCCAVLNFDTPCTELLHREAKKSSAPIVSFGKSDTCTVQLLNHSNNIVSVRVENRKYTYTFPSHGLHFVYDTLAAIGAVQALNLEITDKILNYAFSTFQPKKGKGETHDCYINGKNIKVIDYSYKTNYDSTFAIVDYLKSNYSNSILTAVIGSEGKTGSEMEKISQEVVKKLKFGDALILVSSDRIIPIKEQRVTFYKDTEELIARFEKDHPFIENSIIVVIGGLELDKFVEMLLEKVKQIELIQ